MKIRSTRAVAARLDALASDGVERAEPTGPPTAFRIWKAGLNVTDHGPTVFSERSAGLLMAQQATRGNRFPIDIDHLSLDKDAPLENRRAVGWFGIEVRNGELWAVDVEWTDVVRAGLTKEPPEWRYHSPAYDLDAETNEVIGLLNLAITNLPATHSVTALASRGAEATRMAKKNSMSWGDIKAALDGDDENKKAAAYAVIQAAFPDESEKKDSDGEKPEPDGDEKPDAKAAEDAPKEKCAEDEPEKKDAAEEPAKKDAKASIIADQDAEVRRLSARLAELEKKDEANERKALIAARDMTPALAKTLASKPLAIVREICASLPAKAPKPASTEHVQATRGDGQGDGTSSALPPDQRRALDERMGLRPIVASIKREGVHQIFPTMTPAEARSFRDSQAAKKSAERSK